MEACSLKDATEQQQPLYTKSRIKMGLRTPQGSHQVWIVVEDSDDIHVYTNFFNPHTTRVLPSEGEDGQKGYKNVEAIVREIIEEEVNALIFGIRDKDYTTYKYSPYEYPPSVFHTDYRDIEMTMLASPSVRTSLKEWDNNILPKIDEGKDVTREIGYMRICNYLYNLGCNFKKKVKISLAWDNTSNTIIPNWKCVLMNAFLQNCTNNAFSLSYFNATVAFNALESENYFNICQGHDVLKLLQYMMMHTDQYNETSIMKKMIAAYSLDDFKTTHLYHSILEWASKHVSPF
jgi:hypothetical protein